MNPSDAVSSLVPNNNMPTVFRSHSNDLTASSAAPLPPLNHSHSQRSSRAHARAKPLASTMSGRLSAAGQMSFRRLSNGPRKQVTSGRTNIFAGTFRAKFSQDLQSDDGAQPLITKLDKYSPEELKEYRQVFNMFDTDRSGAIGLDELENAITNLGMDPKQVDLEMLIKEADKRGNHQIDFDEFCEVMKTMSEKSRSWNEVIKECFTVFDRNENGLISKKDFEFVLRELGHITNSTLLDELFIEYDVDSDGFIDFDEFSFLVKNYLTDDDVF